MHTFAASASRRGASLKGILIGLVVVLVVLIVGWVVFLPGIVKSRVTAMTGFPVEASRISVNPFGATVVIAGLQLQNPDGFPIPDFVDLPALDLQVKLLSLRGERIEIPRLAVDLEKVTIVTNKDGVSNVMRLKENTKELFASDSETLFHIGVLEVRLGRVELVDYSKGAEPSKRTFELGVKRTFSDVTEAKQIAGPLLGDIAMANVPGLSAELATLLPPEYSETYGEALKSLGNLLGGSSGSTTEQGKAATDSAKKLFDSLKRDSKP